MNIEQTVAALNLRVTLEFPGTGSFMVETRENIINNFPDANDNDIGIGYDFMDDNLSRADAEKLDSFLYDEAWPRINRVMGLLGYGVRDELDGSGGGLSYGTTLYYKMK